MARVNLDTAPLNATPARALVAQQQQAPIHSTPTAQHSTTSPAAHKPSLVLPTRPVNTRQPALQEAMDESQPDEGISSPPPAAAMPVTSTAQDIMQRWREGMRQPSDPDEPPSAQSVWRQPAPRMLLPPMVNTSGANRTSWLLTVVVVYLLACRCFPGTSTSQASQAAAAACRLQRSSCDIVGAPSQPCA